MLKKLKYFSMLFFIFVSVFSTIGISKALGDESEAISRISQAEDYLKEAYLSVLEAERMGGDVSRLVVLLNTALDYYSMAVRAFEFGTFDVTVQMAERVVDVSSEILEYAVSLGGVAELRNEREFRNHVLLSFSYVCFIVLFGFAGWRLFKYFYNVRPRRLSSLMSLDEWSFTFISICLVLVLIATAPVVMAYLPKRIEPFFALAVLGEEGMMDKYYPDDDVNIKVGDTIDWSLYLYNHMGEIKYVAVKVKLLNSTMLAPNSTSCDPSPTPAIFEIKRFILYNETLLYPFSWSIKDVYLVEDFLSIKLLSLNNEAVETYIVAESGYNFRLIFELWIYNDNLDNFQFSWDYDNVLHCAWNQIWFNVTITE